MRGQEVAQEHVPQAAYCAALPPHVRRLRPRLRAGRCTHRRLLPAFAPASGEFLWDDLVIGRLTASSSRLGHRGPQQLRGGGGWRVVGGSRRTASRLPQVGSR